MPVQGGRAARATQPGSTPRPPDLRVLVVEDEPVDTLLITAMLAEAFGASVEFTCNRSLGEALVTLRPFAPGCVLLDLNLPDSQGLATLDAMLAATADAAVVVLTGLDDEAAGASAVHLGAQDYLIKGRIDARGLSRAIRYAMARREAEVARRLSETRFGDAVKAMIDPVFIIAARRDQSGAISDLVVDAANPAAVALLGMREDELVGASVLDLAPGLPLEAIDQFHRTIDTGEPFVADQRYEGMLGHRAAQRLLFELSLVRFSDGCLLSLRDVTRRQAAEHALDESEQRFRALIEHSSDLILVVDQDGLLVYGSPATSPVLGYEPAELVGTSTLDLVHDDDRPEVATILATAAVNPGLARAATFRVRHASGGWRWVESIANNLLEDPAVRGFVVNARDVTENVEATSSLKRLNRGLRALTAVDAALVHAADEESLLAGMCQLIVDVGGYPLARIAKADPRATGGIAVVESHGVRASPEDLVCAVEPAACPAIADAMRLGRTQFVGRDGCTCLGYEAMAALPLRVDSDLAGLLVIHADSADAFDPAEAELLEQMVGDLGYGLAALRVKADRSRIAEQLARNLNAVIQTIASTVEYRDPYTAGHQRRVALICGAIGRALELDADTILGIETAANIHDLGKISIPAEILSKPAALTAPEREIVREHARAGYEIVRSIEFPWPVAEMILQHHERLDGTGYPEGLAGPAIGMGARIIAVADVIEAMASHRPYRPALGLDAALLEVERQRGVGFDLDVADAALDLFRSGALRLDDASRSTRRDP